MSSHRRRIDLLGLSIRWGSQVYDWHVVDWYFRDTWLFTSGKWFVNVRAGRSDGSLFAVQLGRVWHIGLIRDHRQVFFFHNHSSNWPGGDG